MVSFSRVALAVAFILPAILAAPLPIAEPGNRLGIGGTSTFVPIRHNKREPTPEADPGNRLGIGGTSTFVPIRHNKRDAEAESEAEAIIEAGSRGAILTVYYQGFGGQERIPERHKTS